MKWHISNTASGLVVKEKKNMLDINAIVVLFSLHCLFTTNACWKY